MSRTATKRSFFKDLQHLYKSIDASTDGQASIVGVDEMSVTVALNPKSGHNAHAIFFMTIRCPITYPKTGPDVIFNSPIFHPNIDNSSGAVCLSLLSEWESCHSLLDVVKALLYLIEHPNFHSMNNNFAMLNNSSLLAMKTARLLAGLPVNGRRFPPNTKWCEWALANGCLPTNEEEVEAEEIEEPAVEEVQNSEDYKKDCVAVDVLPDVTALGANVETVDRSSVATSDTVPSFAKIRHSIESEGGSRMEDPFERQDFQFDIETQRVLIWHPREKGKDNTNSVFYYAEMLGAFHHRIELGALYTSLLTGNVLRDDQSHTESCQSSSTCPWYPFLETNYDQDYSYYSPRSPSLCFETLFKYVAPVKRSLTSDFCPWSALDGQGEHDLFSRIFFDRERHGGEFTCFLDADDDNKEGSEGIGRLFSSLTSDHEDVTDNHEEISESESTEPEISNCVNETIAQPDVSLTKKTDVGESEPQHSEPSSISSASNRSDYEEDALMKDCTTCYYEFNELMKVFNLYLGPQWSFLLRQTRWPIRFAPQQNVHLSMADINIPPWRASVGRLMSDLCLFCGKHRDVRNLVLLDPMALSPLSPLLNLMEHRASPIPHLVGALWMTPLDALSPFYRVPIPVSAQNEEEKKAVEDIPYPSPFCLRFLTVTTFFTNWVAWLSRMETYMVFGISRFSPSFISAPVAACLLQPLSLGCGQAPLFDLWPLWLLRRTLTLSLRLPQLVRFLYVHHRYHQFRFLFPFSDLDEI